MAWPTDLERAIRAELAAIAAAGRLRSLRPPVGIDLSSNDYLGLARHPRVVEAFAAAARREGVGATASRLLRGERECFAELEARFAAFVDAEAALLFGSGTLANLGVLESVLGEGDVVFSDALNHASLIDGMRLGRARRVIVPHGDVDALAGLLRRERTHGRRFLVTESLFGMDGDEAPLADWAALCRQEQVALIVDEAHAVGVFGARGRGLIEDAGPDAAPFLAVYPCGKALGVAGALVAGPRWAIDFLRQRARTLIFATAPPPAVADALMAALDLVAAEPERRARVLARARRLRDGLAAAGVPVIPGRSQVLAIPIGDNGRAVAVAARLQVAGFDVRAVRPPTVPAGTARLRVSVHADLDEDVLDRFVATLAEVLAECPAVSS